MDIRGKGSRSKEALETASRELGGEPTPAKSEEAVSAPASGGMAVSELEGVGPKTAKALSAAGYDTVDKIKGLSAEDLTKVEGIGPKTAEKILKSVSKL